MRMRLSVLKGLSLGALLAAGVASLARAQGAAQFDALTIAGGEVRFPYLPRFATTLRGTIRQDGLFRATARARKGVVQMTGRIQGGNVTASIVSSSCAYTFQTRN